MTPPRPRIREGRTRRPRRSQSQQDESVSSQARVSRAFQDAGFKRRRKKKRPAHREPLLIQRIWLDYPKFINVDNLGDRLDARGAGRITSMKSRVRAVGLDFGTTNSAISVILEDGAPHLARFNSPDDTPIESFRSILFFEWVQETGGTESSVSVGNEAIRRYLRAAANGRLIQSLKSFLAVRSFDSTDIMGEQYSLGDLIAPILIELRQAAESQFGSLPPAVTVGRPVHFSDARDGADDAFAQARLDVAVRRAGWDDVRFEYEPVAAAHDYSTRIVRDETVLIGDFGGGTSDFSILRLRTRTPLHRATVIKSSATTEWRWPAMPSTGESPITSSHPRLAAAPGIALRTG